MRSEYFYPPKTLVKANIEFAQVVFQNGDYLTIKKNEILEASLALCDELIRTGTGVCPILRTGFLKCRIQYCKRAKYQNVSLYNPQEYIKDRKSYIENRCVKEGKIKAIRVFDANDWHYTLYGEIVASVEGENMVLSFRNSAQSNDSAVIRLKEPKKSTIGSIVLDFENCDTFRIYENEIMDIQLAFRNELVWEGNELNREVVGGFLRLKFDKSTDHTDVNIYKWNGKIKQLEERLCGRKGEDFHDICHLYIEDAEAYKSRQEECISICDIRYLDQPEPPEDEDPESEESEGDFEETDSTPRYEYVGGLAQKQPDGSILLSFGRTALKAMEEHGLCID